MSDAVSVASDQMRRYNHKLRAIYLHIVKALLAQIERLQTAHHPALTPQQPGFVLVEIAKLGAQFIERQRNYINPFDFQWLIFLFIDRTDIEDHVVRAEAIDGFHFHHFLLGLLDSYHVPPSLLELELTESAFVGNEMHARPTMDRLREAGLTFSIDDFGTGFSSITTLCLLPFDVLKLDKGLLVNCLSNPRMRTLLHHLVPLGREMGMEVVAEGVETVDQARFLMECGCDQAQGFLFSRPLAAEDFTRRCLEVEGPFTSPLRDERAAEEGEAPAAPRP